MGNTQKVEKGTTVTLHCIDGLIFTGDVIDYNYTLFSRLEWVKIRTKKKIMAINSDYIISITWQLP